VLSSSSRPFSRPFRFTLWPHNYAHQHPSVVVVDFFVGGKVLSNELICNKTRMIKCSGPVRTGEEVGIGDGVLGWGRGGSGCEFRIGTVVGESNGRWLPSRVGL